MAAEHAAQLGCEVAQRPDAGVTVGVREIADNEPHCRPAGGRRARGPHTRRRRGEQRFEIRGDHLGDLPTRPNMGE